MIEKIKGLLDGFDIMKILPEMESFLGHVQPVLRFAVLIGPVCLLILGLMYLLVPTREANRHFGYRCFYGMGSQNAWKMTQRIVGVVWTAMGIIMIVVMTLFSAKFATAEVSDAVAKAIRYVLWEIGLIALSCIAVDITMAVLYDRNGNRRGKK